MPFQLFQSWGHNFKSLTFTIQKLTDVHTHTQTDRQAESNMPFQLFQNWGHNKCVYTLVFANGLSGISFCQCKYRWFSPYRYNSNQTSILRYFYFYLFCIHLIFSQNTLKYQNQTKYSQIHVIKYNLMVFPVFRGLSGNSGLFGKYRDPLKSLSMR